MNVRVALGTLLLLCWCVGRSQWEDLSNPLLGSIQKLKFISPSMGWMISNFGQQEGLFQTTDGGRTWNRILVPPPGTFNGFYDFDFFNERVGFAVTLRDSAYRTTTGGATWVRSQGPHRPLFSKPSLTFISEGTAYFSDLISFHVTSDTAKTWQLRSLFPVSSNAGIFDMVVRSSDTIIAAGGAPPLLIDEWTGTVEIFKSTNAGFSWNTMLFDTLYPIGSLSFVNNKIGYALPFLSSTPGVHHKNFKTTDGGTLWFEIPALLDSGSTPVEDSYFKNPFEGFVCGNRLAHTTDGGASWATLPNVRANHDSSLYSMFWLDSLNGWVCGMYGKLYRTTSGGWLPIQLASFAGRHLGGTRVQLDWHTLSETNNLGFYVERRRETDSTFVEISALIPGYGTTNEPHDYSWMDSNATIARWYYRLKQVDLNGPVHYTEQIIVDVTTGIGETVAPHEFRLEQNYPNPFNPTTTITFSVGTYDHTSLRVYDVLGREVATLVNETKQPGNYNTPFDGSNLSSGVYIYRLLSGGRSESRKLLLLR